MLKHSPVILLCLGVRAECQAMSKKDKVNRSLPFPNIIKARFKVSPPSFGLSRAEQASAYTQAHLMEASCAGLFVAFASLLDIGPTANKGGVSTIVVLSSSRARLCSLHRSKLRA